MRMSVAAPAALLTVLTLHAAHAQSTPPRNSASNAAQTEAEAEPSNDPGSVKLVDPRPTQGHFVALGLHGVSAMAFDEDRGTRKPTFGQGVSLRLGQSVTDWLGLSLAFAYGSTYGKQRDSLTLIRFGIASQWYFSEHWFVQAGFGAINAQGSDPEDYQRSRSRYGDVYLTGLGYNLYLSDRTRSGGWTLTPILTLEVGPDSKFTTTALGLGVELCWWSGLSRDKLNLPTSKAYSR